MAENFRRSRLYFYFICMFFIYVRYICEIYKFMVYKFLRHIALSKQNLLLCRAREARAIGTFAEVFGYSSLSACPAPRLQLTFYPHIG
jgi:hypothetical protein